MRLCLYEQLGDANLVNTEEQLYTCLTTDDIMAVARRVLQPAKCSTVIYHGK